MILTQKQSILKTDIQKKKKTKHGLLDLALVLEDTQTQIGMKITIVLSNISDSNFLSER